MSLTKAKSCFNGRRKTRFFQPYLSRKKNIYLFISEQARIGGLLMILENKNKKLKKRQFDQASKGEANVGVLLPQFLSIFS